MNQHFCILSSKKDYKTYEDLFKAFREGKKVAVMEFCLVNVRKWRNDYNAMKFEGLQIIKGSIDCLYPKYKENIFIKDKENERKRLKKIIKDTTIELNKLK